MAHPARLPGAGREDSDDLLTGRSGSEICAACRRGCLHWPRAVRFIVLEYAGDYQRRRGQRRRSGSPGLRFLSENANFAERVEQSGFIFIGPRPETIRLMGGKVTAKQTMLKAGVPCVPGSEGVLPEEPKEIIQIARRIGYPVIIK